MAKKVTTRYDEVNETLTASQFAKALGKYAKKPVRRTWMQDVLNTETKQVEKVQKYETIISKGACIDKDDIVRLQFYAQAGELESIEVTNQRRQSEETGHYHMIAMIAATVGTKTVKLIMHALNIPMALDIARDFIEQTYDKDFTFTSAKVTTTYHIIEETLLQLKDCKDEQAIADEYENARFYEISARYATWTEAEKDDNSLIDGIFLVRTSDVDIAKEVIWRYLLKWRKEKSPDEEWKARVVIDEAKICSFNKVLPYEFCAPYIKAFKCNQIEQRYQLHKISYEDYQKELEELEKMRMK